MRYGIIALILISILSVSAAKATAHPPVEDYGQLAVKGHQIVDEKGDPVSLAGVSWFWSTSGWGQERFYNKDVVKFLAEDWNVSLIRAAISVEPSGGILTDPQGNIDRATTLIDAAIEEGLYVIVDWHSHSAEDHPDAAVVFFTEIAKMYGSHPNIIYEIYNEPLNDTDWLTVIKPYAEKVISAIREVDPDNLIIVGTQTWSQDVNKAAAKPIKGYENIAYTLHFYAGSHGEELRKKARLAMQSGIALFVSEWGTVDANGDGDVAGENLTAWRDFMKEHQLSHANWSLSDKDEGASLLKPGANSTGRWRDEDLTESGLYVREMVRTWSAD
jgi:aryl-phospho-beta-D-glucosidase BglC (GH1 family)